MEIIGARHPMTATSEFAIERGHRRRKPWIVVPKPTGENAAPGEDEALQFQRADRAFAVDARPLRA